VFADVGPFRPEVYGIGSDVEMWLRIVRRHPVAILDERLIRYRKGRHQWSARYMHERTEPEAFFGVLDEYLGMDGWLEKLAPGDLTEYAFHRGDDATFRAANLVRKGDAERALALLRAYPFPWSTLRAGPRRRKLRNIALRTIIRAGIAMRARQPLTFFLERIGP
ncbi:MAG: hypothetical protein ACREPM_07680, partial [Gemmatimonadaceae bacterium]